MYGECKSLKLLHRVLLVMAGRRVAPDFPVQFLLHIARMCCYMSTNSTTGSLSNPSTLQIFTELLPIPGHVSREAGREREYSTGLSVLISTKEETPKMLGLIQSIACV